MKIVLFSLLVVITFGHPSFSQGTADTGVLQENTQKVTITKADTARAVRNLFVRKQRGGTARAIVFGTLGTVALIATLAYQPDQVIINQGSGGTQRMDIGSSPDPANYAFIAFNVVMTITGITQHRKYNGAMLKAVLANYEQVGGLPPKIKSKLRKKDFGM